CCGYLHPSFLDGIELGAIAGAHVGHRTYIGRRGRQGPERGADLRPGAAGLGVEAVVGIPAAPADGRDELARVLGIGGDVVDDVLVRRGRVSSLRTTGQVGGVRGVLQRPGAVQVGQRMRVQTTGGGRVHGGADEPDLADAGRL